MFILHSNPWPKALTALIAVAACGDGTGDVMDATAPFPDDGATQDLARADDGAVRPPSLPDARVSDLPCNGAPKLTLLDSEASGVADRDQVTGALTNNSLVLLWNQIATSTGSPMYAAGVVRDLRAPVLDTVAPDLGVDGKVLLGTADDSALLVHYLESTGGQLIEIRLDGTTSRTAFELDLEGIEFLQAETACQGGPGVVLRGGSTDGFALVQMASIVDEEVLPGDRLTSTLASRAPGAPAQPAVLGCVGGSSGSSVLLRGPNDREAMWIAEWTRDGRIVPPGLVSLGSTAEGLATGALTNLDDEPVAFTLDGGGLLRAFRLDGAATRETASVVVDSLGDLLGGAQILGAFALPAGVGILYSTRAYLWMVEYSSADDFGPPILVADVPCSTRSLPLDTGDGVYLPLRCALPGLMALFSVCAD